MLTCCAPAAWQRSNVILKGYHGRLLMQRDAPARFGRLCHRRRLRLTRAVHGQGVASILLAACVLPFVLLQHRISFSMM